MSNGAGGQSVMTSEVEINGVIKSSGAVRMEGKLDGDIVCAGDVVIGKTARIKGSISASSVAIEGTINGTVSAKDKVEMKSTAHITGDIKSKRLSVEDGVTFVGKSDVNPSGAPSKAEPEVREEAKSSFLGKGRNPFAAT
jgi:cytoskeletal protein CcmA (bactofilin family)